MYNMSYYYSLSHSLSFQAIDIFMSSCTVFVFLSLIEYAFVNVMMGDISEVERKDKTSHLRNIIVTANTNLGYRDLAWQQQQQLKYHGNKVIIYYSRIFSLLECLPSASLKSSHHRLHLLMRNSSRFCNKAILINASTYYP